MHFGVARVQDQSLYRRLLAADVYRSGGITKNISLSINAFTTSVVGASGNLHLEDDQNQLRLYVPEDGEERELCYLYQIPEKLASHLGMANTAAFRVLGDIVKASRSSLLKRLLDDHGIVRVAEVEEIPPPVVEGLPVQASMENSDVPILHPAADQPNQSSLNTPRRGSTASTLVANHLSPSSTSHRDSSVSKGDLTPATGSSTIAFGSPRSDLSPEPPRPRMEFGRGLLDFEMPRLGVTLEPPLRSRSQPPREPAPEGRFETLAPSQRSRSSDGREPSAFEQVTHGNGYRDLLNSVITAASQARLPPFAPMVPPIALGFEPNALSDAIFGNRSVDQMSHDTKIGAAGELYVCPHSSLFCES